MSGSDAGVITGLRWDTAEKVHHLTPQERAARGKAARREVPRGSHALFEPGPGRPDPVDLLEQQAATRVPELVPIRYGRMLTSPFAFFRGGALVMAADLAGTPTSGLRVQLCGDAHLSNFGAYGSPERRLVFDINDFDETNPGPWEWDVKRLAASFEIASRERQFEQKTRQEIVLRVGRAYREAMTRLAGVGNLDVWYQRADVDDLMRRLQGEVDRDAYRRAAQNVAKARSRDSLHSLDKLTRVVDGERRIVSDPPLIVPMDELRPEGMSRDQLEEAVRQLLRGYRQTLESDRRVLLEGYEFVDMARKVVGVGSVGTRAWVVLLQGRDGTDPLFLQFKQAQRSVLEDYAGVSQYATAGERVVAGQRLMQSTSDIFLGWLRVVGPEGHELDFYVRQLRDWKGSIEVESLRPLGMQLYADLCGAILARAHARSGDRIAIASYLGTSDTFDRALAVFADVYADQNEADYAALQQAVAGGRVTALTGL